MQQKLEQQRLEQQKLEQQKAKSIDLAAAREDLAELAEDKDTLLKLLKQVEGKVAAEISELAQTESEYRSSATKAEADAAAKKVEAGETEEAARQQDKEAGRLTDFATKYGEVADWLSAEAQAGKTKTASINTLLG